MLLAEQRQQKICDYLLFEPAISIHRAAEICNTSEATARRDLDALAKKGLVQRTHGGAVPGSAPVTSAVNTEKLTRNAEAKAKIAHRAADLIQDGDRIFLDSGTTLLCLGLELHRFRRLTVITDNLDLAVQCQLDASSTMFLLGGIVLREFGVTEGPISEEIASRLTVDIAFIGADGIDKEGGICCGSFVEVGVKQTMMRNSASRVLVADHSKFGVKTLVKIAELSEFQTVITDSSLEEEYRAAISAQGPELILA